MNFTTERFTRSLDERPPYVRSSTVEIVPMGEPRMHPADRIVLVGCVLAAVGLVALLVWEALA
jgi:hypothetical protein